MTIELEVDKPEIMQKIKDTIDTSINYDYFYYDLNFTLNLDDYSNFDIFGCWNSNCVDKLIYSHLGSFQQKSLSKIIRFILYIIFYFFYF